MKIKSLILLIGLLALASSCANQGQVFSIDGFKAVGPGCEATEAAAANGHLDVAAGNARYFVGVSVSGAESLSQRPVSIGGTVIEQANRDRPIITSMVVSYRLSKRVGAAPKPYTTLMSHPFGEAGSVSLIAQLISPELALALFDGLPPSSSAMEEFVDIQADVEFKGEFSGSRTSFSTGVLTFPIRAYRSTPTTPCTNGYAPFVEDMSSGEVDFCRYVGQSASQNEVPRPPSVCCGAGGC